MEKLSLQERNKQVKNQIFPFLSNPFLEKLLYSRKELLLIGLGFIFERFSYGKHKKNDKPCFKDQESKRRKKDQGQFIKVDSSRRA